MNVAHHLTLQASARPEATAIIQPLGRRWLDGSRKVRRVSYAELDRESDLLGKGLLASGVPRGTRAALMVRPSPELFALVFGMFKAGIVPVMIDPGIGFKHLKRCLAQARPGAFVGIPAAHVARATLGWGRETVTVLVNAGHAPLPGHLSLAELRRRGASAQAFEPTQASETAAILFTSGSTGTPKGVVYTHASFSAQVEIIRETYGIQPGEVDLPTFPLFAIFDPALGMTTVIPEMDPTRPARCNPEKILSAVRDFEVTHLFGSPALLNRVGRYGAARGIKLPTVKRVLSAGAPVPAATLERFGKLLTGSARIHTPYGATEALPVASIDSAEVLVETRHRSALGAGTCVGRPVARAEVRVIPISDEPISKWSDSLALPPGRIGEIAVKGPVVTREYFGLDEANRLAKIPDLDGGFYHRMGDLGYLDEQGRLWFCGRKSQRVVTSSDTMYTIPCEGVFNAHPAVFRTALVGVKPKAPGEAPSRLPVLCVELEDKRMRRSARERVAGELRELARKHEHTQKIEQVLFHPGFPVDIRHNSKIFREKLSVWAEGRV